MKLLHNDMVEDWYTIYQTESTNGKLRRQDRNCHPVPSILNKDKASVSSGDDSHNHQTKQIHQSSASSKRELDAFYSYSQNLTWTLRMAETLSSNGDTCNMIDEAVYWLSQPQLIPSTSQDGQSDEDLAATPTPHRPIIPKSMTIPETVDENDVINGNPPSEFTFPDHDHDRFPNAITQPRVKQLVTECDQNSNTHHLIRCASSSAASSPAADSEDEMIQTSNILPPPINRFMSSSPPLASISIRRGSGGVSNPLLSRTSAGKPLRTSSSATHLPLLQSNATSKSTSPYYYVHPSHYAAMMNGQMSDSESVGSADSMQDLNGPIASTSNCRMYRQSSGDGKSMYPIRGPLSNVTCNSVNSILSSSPTNSVCSVRNSLTGQPLNRIMARSYSVFEEDLIRDNTATTWSTDGHHMAKHLNTEKVVSKHTLKGRMSRYQKSLDKAFALINIGTEDSIVDGCDSVARIMINAWITPKMGHDLAYGLCDYLRETTYFDLLLNFFLHAETKHRVKLAAGRALEECLSYSNRDYLASTGDGVMLTRMVDVLKSFQDSDEEIGLFISLLESLFKHSARTNSKLFELSTLEYVLGACKKTRDVEILKRVSLALANLAIYSDNECQKHMIAKNVPDWLFFLASSRDDVTRYYACLAACILVSNKEFESAVTKSGTLSLVEQFLLAHRPADFATSDYKNIQGRPREWLEKLVPVLHAKRRESRAMASFHFAMEAGIKRDQERLELFLQIGAVEALRQVAALPEDVAPKFAAMALEIIGAEVPHKLTPQVPLWSVEDVQYWVTHIGFEKYAQAFGDQRVDGDLLLLLGETELQEDIGMHSGLLRRRFMRELEGLKMAADYSCVDETQLDRFLVSIDPHFSIYTYQLLELGIDRSMLPSLTDDLLKNSCEIENPIHRLKMMKSIEECKHIDDMEVALLSKHIDIFISYRRSTGNQLASLIKVLLQLRGYKVFIDVDRLYAGKFDCSLLKNIQAAKHFVLVLTPQSLNRCVDDNDCNDWLHKELLCALQSNKNIIPVFDPQFEWPDESRLPNDIRGVTRFNGVRWVHEYQEACVDKLEKFIEGELNMDIHPSPSRVNPASFASIRTGSRGESTDLVLDALNVANRGRASSQDYYPNGNMAAACLDSIESALHNL